MSNTAGNTRSSRLFKENDKTYKKGPEQMLRAFYYMNSRNYIYNMSCW